MTLLIPFPSHTVEASAEGTLHAQNNHAKFSGDCQKLMKFWQSGKWYWLSNEDGRTFGISSYLSARVYDLIRQGVQIEKKWDEKNKIKRFRLKCTCRIIGGSDVVSGCYVHDQTLMA